MASTATSAADRYLHPVEHAWLLLVYTLETHGWTLLFALVALYVLRERYRAWAAARARRQSLQQANGTILAYYMSAVRLYASCGRWELQHA